MHNKRGLIQLLTHMKRHFRCFEDLCLQVLLLKDEDVSCGGLAWTSQTPQGTTRGTGANVQAPHGVQVCHKLGC